MHNAFLTGSRAYGTPRDDSDIDLMILLPVSEIPQLVAQADASDDLSKVGDGASLRFGKLNLLVVSDPVRFQSWRLATSALVARKPVSRDEAVHAIDGAIATEGGA